MARLDRFSEPTRADDFVLCAGCPRQVHYEECDEAGFCSECSAEWCDEDVKAIKGKDSASGNV